MNSPHDVASQCFGCSRDASALGGVILRHTSESTIMQFAVRDHHQSVAGLLHGGVIASMLDEVMGVHAWNCHGPCATVQLNVTFHAPIRTGVIVWCHAVLLTAGSRRLQLNATAHPVILTSMPAASASAVFAKKKDIDGNLGYVA